MTVKEFNAALEKLGLGLSTDSQLVGAAERLGIHDRTARRYAHGEREIPWEIAVQLRLEVSGDKETLEAIKKARG